MTQGALVLVAVLLGPAGIGQTADRQPEVPLRPGSDWPQWRGVQRDAVSLEGDLLDRWPDAGPDVLWRVQVGPGFSGVSAVDGSLYTLWDDAGKQFLVALESATGKERWRVEVGPGFTNSYGDGPRSTPLVHDGLVFAIGTQGRLLAVDARTGESRWQHDLVGAFGARLPSYGYASSPLIVDDKIVVEAGAEQGAFMAFDHRTGVRIWASQNDTAAYSSPIRATLGGVDQIVFWSAHGLHSISPGDGRLLWKFPWQTLCPASGAPLNTGTPIFVAPDSLFVSSGSGAAVLRIVAAESGFQVETVWKNTRMKSDVNTAVLLGHYVYGFDRGFLQCLDVRTGEVKWRARGFQRGSLIAADNKLVVLGERGKLAIVEASPEGYVEKDSAQVLSGRSWTSPSLAGGRLYLRNQEELVCLDMRE